MKTIFQIGDKVFDYNYGWGEVAKFDDFDLLIVKFQRGNVGYEPNGCRPSSYLPTLSFTEYTLNGFSQERPIDYKDYIGKLGMFWDNEDSEGHRVIRRLKDFREDEFQTDTGYWFNNFKPLTDEQIKILEL